jgi:hypothetical protein
MATEDRSDFVVRWMKLGHRVHNQVMTGNSLAMVGILGTLIALAFSIASVAWLAWWMLEPVNRAAGSLKAPTRFQLIDFVALMLLLQIGLAICGQGLSASEAGAAATRMYWLLLALTAFLVVVLWSASVSVVSRAGIGRPLRRLIVIVVLVPGTLAMILAAPALVVMIIAGIAGLFRRDPEIDWLQRQLPWTALAVPCAVALVLTLRRLSFWSLGGSTYAATTGPGSASSG